MNFQSQTYNRGRNFRDQFSAINYAQDLVETGSDALVRADPDVGGYTVWHRKRRKFMATKEMGRNGKTYPRRVGNIIFTSEEDEIAYNQRKANQERGMREMKGGRTTSSRKGERTVQKPTKRPRGNRSQTARTEPAEKKTAQADDVEIPESLRKIGQGIKKTTRIAAKVAGDLYQGMDDYSKFVQKKNEEYDQRQRQRQQQPRPAQRRTVPEPDIVDPFDLEGTFGGGERINPQQQRDYQREMADVMGMDLLRTSNPQGKKRQKKNTGRDTRPSPLDLLGMR